MLSAHPLSLKNYTSMITSSIIVITTTIMLLSIVVTLVPLLFKKIPLLISVYLYLVLIAFAMLVVSKTVYWTSLTLFQAEKQPVFEATQLQLLSKITTLKGENENLKRGLDACKNITASQLMPHETF